MPTFSQHHGQITKAFPSFTEIIFKLLSSFKRASLIPPVFGDQIKWFELQKYIILQPLHVLISAQSFFFFFFLSSFPPGLAHFWQLSIYQIHRNAKQC